MARKKQAEGEVHEEQGGEEKQPELKKFSVKNSGTIVNGHNLKAGTVIELTDEEATNHRNHGMALDDVASDDKREVFDCREAYVAKDENDD